jgi:hypothetical protein
MNTQFRIFQENLYVYIYIYILIYLFTVFLDGNTEMMMMMIIIIIITTVELCILPNSQSVNHFINNLHCLVACNYIKWTPGCSVVTSSDLPKRQQTSPTQKIIRLKEYLQ